MKARDFALSENQLAFPPLDDGTMNSKMQDPMKNCGYLRESLARGSSGA